MHEKTPPEMMHNHMNPKNTEHIHSTTSLATVNPRLTLGEITEQFSTTDNALSILESILTNKQQVQSLEDNIL